MEVVLGWPWYVATVQDPHEPLQRTFALGANDDVLLFAAGSPAGKLVALQLVVPRHEAAARTWELIPIVAVERYTEDTNARPLAVVTTHDGSKYGGVPVERIEPPRRLLTPLVRFEPPAEPGASSQKHHRRAKRPNAAGQFKP